MDENQKQKEEIRKQRKERDLEIETILFASIKKLSDKKELTAADANALAAVATAFLGFQKRHFY